MSSSTDSKERAIATEGSGSDDRTTRGLLKAILLILAVGTVALLGLLLWLLRPEPAAEATAEGGYPIEVVTTIYGRGDAAEDLIRAPLGVTFDPQGDVWISNTGQSRVERYTSDGEFVRSIGEEQGPGKLYAPYGLAIDDARGRVFVADYGSGLVQVYTTDGGYVAHWPADDQDPAVFGPGGFSPYDIELVGGRVVVASNDGLYFFDDSGHVVARWGATLEGENVRGVKVGMFNFPDAIDADPVTGRIYVADSLNRRIVALGQEGRWLWVSGKPDANDKIRGFWQLPRGIAVGQDGNIYVVDTFRYDIEGMGVGHLVVLSPDGELLSEFGRSGFEEGSFNFPEHLTAGPDGLWALADRENNRVVIFRLLTPYPQPEQLEVQEYDGMLKQPQDVWATPSPEPAG